MAALDAIEPDVDVAPTPLSNEKIARDRETAFNPPTQPMDAATDDVIIQPANSNFNNMAQKLEKAMKEVTQPTQRIPDKSPAPQKQVEEPKRPADPNKPAATPEAPTETPPEEKTITSAKAADWNKVKQRAADAEKKAKELEQTYALITKEYEEFKKKTVPIERLEEIDKKRQQTELERDSYKKHIDTIALEQSPEFKSQYDNKFNEALNRAKDSVGDKSEQIASLLQLPPSKWRKEQINTIREELSGVDQGQLDVAIAAYDSTRKEREEALKNGEENYKKMLGLQAEKQNRAREMDAARVEAMTNSIIDMARQYDAFKPGDNEEKKASAMVYEDRLRRFVSGKLDGRELAMMPILAAEHERITKSVLPEMEKEMKELRATVAEYEKANPTGNTQPTSQAAPTSNDPGFINHFMRLRPNQR